MTAGRARALVIACIWLAACSEISPVETAAGTATRVVTLAPNLAELMFAAGAGETLVGVSAYSDYPPAVLDLPQVGDAFMLDQEQLALLHPDLLLVWQSGTPQRIVDELKRLGYRVEIIRTRSLEDVATALQRIGELTGHAGTANAAAASYLQDLRSLQGQFRGFAPLRVFYQITQRPLYTVNGEHYVSELIESCGGTNIFADLSDLAPTVDVEAVIERDPEVMLASTDAGDDAFAEWERWPHIAANDYDNHFLLPADEIGRATPRVLIAAEVLCDVLQTARERRDSSNTTP